MFIAYTSILFILFFILSSFLGGNSSDKARQPFFGRSYAHRGLFTKDQSIPENSLAAFAAAVHANYGITADVQITKDRRIVVFNDGHLTRMCGVKLKVEELTYEELQGYTLAGSDETIPLLSDLLAVVDGQVPIILYLRPGTQNSLLCKITSEMILAYDGPLAVASMAPGIVGWFKDHKQTKHILRGSIAAPRSYFPQGNDLHYFLISHGFLNATSRPQFIIWPDEPRNLTIRGACYTAMAVAGTIEGPDFERHMETNDMLVFEHGTPPVQYKEPKDYAAMIAEYDKRRNQLKDPNAGLIDAYLDATLEDEAEENEQPKDGQ
ncbi:hypothetical protein LJB77_02840 [Ruminococcaceae bacterium OttesenSCG-928-N02]|nr:hypothetical protein [Ruminococcaceae bacterium OttesenSCG-928-N02]